MQRLRDLQAFPDSQRFLCHDRDAAARHAMDVPFPCGIGAWRGGGQVTIELESRADGLMSRIHHSTDSVPLKSLEPVPGATWQFTVPAWQSYNTAADTDDADDAPAPRGP